MSVGTNVAAIAASLLSRGAATDRSHGRKAVVRVSFRTEPQRGDRFARNLSPLRGSSSYGQKTPGSRPGLRSAAATRLYSDALSRDILDSKVGGSRVFCACQNVHPAKDSDERATFL